MRKYALTAVAAVLGIALLAYGPSLHNGFVRWDDNILITENPAVMAPSVAGVAWAFTHFDPELYIPLTFLSYQFDSLLGGGQPWAFHFTSLLLHTVNALLLLAILSTLIRRRSVALLASLLFLVHPLHTETIAWASGRKDVLSAFFALASVLAYLRYRPLLSPLLFLLALLSKVAVAPLPIVLLLLDRIIDRPLDWRALFRTLPYFFFSAIFVVVALLGKSAVAAQMSILPTLLLSTHGSALLLGKILLPIRLSVLYPFTDSVSFLHSSILLSLIAIVGTVAVAVLLYRRAPFVSVGVAVFSAMLLPTAFAVVKATGDLYVTSDRYAYLPSVGILAIVAIALCPFLRSFPGRATLGVLLLALSVLTVRQSLVWRDSEALFAHVLALHPRAYVAHNNYGNALRARGDLPAAVRAYEAALAIRPNARTESNLGAALRKMGRTEEARQAYERARALDPVSAEALTGLGLVAAAEGRGSLAQDFYRRAAVADPSFEEAEINLGALLLKEGDTIGARAAFLRAIRSNPLSPEAHFNLGVVLQKTGDDSGAEEEYVRATKLRPRFIAAIVNLGLLLAKRGDTASARTQFEAILRFDPENAAARAALDQLR